MSESLETWLARIEAAHPVTIDLGLERCGEVWQRLGAPRPGHHVITVAGTNGKGSCVAWLESLARAAGCRTAAYTSPHILRFNERLRLNGFDTPDDDWIRAFQAVEAAQGGVSMTYFEFTTLAALWLMAEATPDVALLEVGLGGRLDTVNLVDADAVVMMPIGLDHQAFLGDDRESIGSEKAGVLREGQVLVCAELAPPSSVLQRAADLGIRPWRAGRDFSLSPSNGGLVYVDGTGTAELPEPPLAGGHQQTNLGAALAAWRSLGIGDVRSWAAGVERARLPGRLMPVDGQPNLLIDVGHNPMAAEAVSAHLSDQGGDWICVLGMLGDKDARGAVVELDAVVSEWFCGGLDGERGQTGDCLALRVNEAEPAGVVHAFHDVAAALEAAMVRFAESPGEFGGILVFGSFETAGQAWRTVVDLDGRSPETTHG